MKTIAAVLLFAWSLPALAAPLVLRPEVPVSAPEYGRSGGGGDLRLVTDGHEYLAVWTDFREGGAPVVYAARLRADGTLLDPLGLRIAEGAYAGPAVWTGSKYLISYQSAQGSDSYIRTMTPDAVFGEPRPAGRGARYGGMATNGTNILLVLPQHAMLLDLEGNQLREVPAVKIGASGRRIEVAAAGSTYLVAALMDGVVVQTVWSGGDAGAPQTIAEAKTGFYRVGLASDGERFLVVWPEALQLVARVVGPDGAPAGPAHVLAPNITDFPSVAWRDGEYLLLFQERTLYSHYALRVAADGTPIGTPKRLAQEAPDYAGVTEVAVQGRGGIALFGRLQAGLFDDASLATEDVFRRLVDVQVTARPQGRVRIARLGDGYVAAWHEGGRIMLSTGAGTTPVALEGGQYPLIELLVDRSNIIWVIWQGWSSTVIHLSRFWGDLTPIDPAPISFLLPLPGWQATAAAGDGAIALAYVAMAGEDPLDQDVYAVLLRETGTGIARKDVRLTTEPEWDHAPVVAFDGSSFVYAWSHAKERFDEVDAPLPEFELAGARVSPDGDLLDASPVRIAQDVGWIRKIDAAPGANGVGFAWQAEDRTTRLALFNGTGVDLGGPQTSLAELAPHDGGFLLLHGLRRMGIEEVEYVILGAALSVQARGALPPYPSRRQHEGSDLDVDVIGGSEPVFVYAKVAHDGPYGHVSRVFVRRTGEAPPRRRVVR